MEIEEARTVVRKRLPCHPSPAPFLDAMRNDYDDRTSELDVFCMSPGLQGPGAPQDMLSRWRAYAQDGRGGAMTLDAHALATIAWNVPALRINPVIYDRADQDAFVDAVLSAGSRLHAGHDPDAVAATVAALVHCTPLMKNPGFAEEREWRLLFMPVTEGPTPEVGFHPRRDFLAPFVRLRRIWELKDASGSSWARLPSAAGEPTRSERAPRARHRGHDRSIRPSRSRPPRDGEGDRTMRASGAVLGPCRSVSRAEGAGSHGRQPRSSSNG